MDISCVWFCHSQVRCMTGAALLTFVCLGAMTVLLQSMYLHATLGETLITMLPGSISQRLMRGSQKPVPNFHYHAFGRPQAVITFELKEKDYEYNFHGNDTKFNILKHPKLFNSFYNGNITIHHRNPLSFLKASNNNMYIMSAFDRSRFSFQPHVISKNQETISDRHYTKHKHESNNNIVLTGWMALEKVNRSLLCCLLTKNNTVLKYTNTKRIVWTQVKKADLMATKVTCPLPRNVSREEIIGATITAPVEHCKKKQYIEIENVKKAANGSIALCSKIAYGTVSAQRLIEWLEIQRYIGVDKVIIYVYNLNSEAMAVLRHYTKDGLIDIVPFDMPKPEIERYVGQKDAQPFIDEQVVVFDCMERLRGYTYVGVMDVDEILNARISPDHNLKHLMQRLHKRSPLAAGFSFRTELFITEWPIHNLTATERRFWHSSHQNRTRPLVDRVKNLLMTDRIVLASVWTHNYTAKPGFTRYPVPASVATLQHYRPCRQNWHCYMRRGYRDRSIASIVTQLKDTLLNKFRILNITGNNA